MAAGQGASWPVIWGPWSGIGMVSELEDHLGSPGLGMIPPSSAGGCCSNELLYGRKGEVEVVLAGDLGTLDDAAGAHQRLDGGRPMRPGRGHDIAIVGMACRFPGARDLFAFWANILANRDVTRDVPAERWAAGRLLTIRTRAPTTASACRRGGYLDTPIPFDPAAHGIMPLAVEGW